MNNKCKKIIVSTFSFVLAISSISFPTKCSLPITTLIGTAAEDVPLNPGIQYENCGDHIEITGYDGSYTQPAGIELEIPETIEGLPVTKIAAGAFKGMKDLYILALPMTVEEIGEEACAGCTGLWSVHYSTSLHSIGKRAFYHCALQDLLLPETVSEIGEEAFAGISRLKYVVLPDALKTIRRGVFSGDGYIASISIPASVERVDKNAFTGCERIQTVCYKGSANAWAVLPIGSGNECLHGVTLLCDYNKRKVDRPCTFDPEKDTWGFSNKDLENYLLSDKSLAEMTSGMNILDKRCIEKYWRETDAYTGACLGYATTSMLAAYGILDPSELDPDAKCLHDVKLTDEVRELLTYYWTLQGTDSYKVSDIRTPEKWDYYLEQGIPVLFWYGGYYYDGEEKNVFLGHAVVAYGVERGHYEFDGKVFTTKLLTYDSNVTEENGWDGSIYIDCENPDWYSDVLLPEQKIYVPYTASHGQASMMWFPPNSNIDFINLFGKNKGIKYVEPEQKCAIFRTAVLPAEYKMQSFAPGSPQTRADVAYTPVKAGSYQALQCTDGTKGYVLEMQDKQDLDCSMSYENWLYSVNGSDIASAAFEPDGAVSIRGENMEYELMMVADDQHPTSYYELHIFGENADAVSVQQKQGGYVIDATDLHDVTVEALNDSKALALSFSTDVQRVLVHETERKTLAVSADLDEDGFYETLLVSGIAPDLGDVNCDGSINAKDASEILIASSRAGTGQGTGLTEAQQKAADVDHDGSLNAEDAAWILRYAAAVGTGTAPKTIEEYISLQES